MEEKNFYNEILDAVIILDKKAEIEEVNLSAVNLLGCKSKQELLGKPISQLCKNFDVEGIAGKLPLQNCEMIYLSKEGLEIPVNVNITIKKDNRNEIENIIFIARDIREVKELIRKLTISGEELRKAYSEQQSNKDELVRSEKLAFTGRIAASIAHEIRNPLTNVTMSLYQLRKVFKPQDRKFQYVELVMRNVARINFLITELLNCARPPKFNVRSYDLHCVLENVLKFSNPKIKERKIEVIKKFAAKFFIMKMDKEQMECAFSNIINNAIEAMSKRGTLTITTEFLADFFVVKIQDTGKGIPSKDIIKIYDPFFSSKAGGIGLGLSICYGIIVGHGGTIEVESKLREGSIFTVSLPVKRV